MVCQVDGLGDGLNKPHMILTIFPDSKTHEYTRKQVIELKSTNRFWTIDYCMCWPGQVR